MVAALQGDHPGRGAWPRFVRNRSEQFEARLALVKIIEAPVGAVARHGRVAPSDRGGARRRARRFADRRRPRRARAGRAGRRALRRSPRARPTELYPDNPNGSPGGITALTTRDGRVTILMPHPERVFRAVQFSWRPRAWQGRRPLDAHLPERPGLGRIVAPRRRRGVRLLLSTEADYFAAVGGVVGAGGGGVAAVGAGVSPQVL